MHMELESLARVVLEGPAVPRPRGLKKETPWSFPPFWTFVGSAPFFSLGAVEPKKNAVQEDRIHPIRSLAIDPLPRLKDGKPWRDAHLAALHVIAGEETGPYSSAASWESGWGNGPVKLEFLHVVLHQQKPTETLALHFRTADPETSASNAHAIFQHCFAEPLTDGEIGWPPEFSHLRAPRYRLVSGAIELEVDKGEFDWLGPLRMADNQRFRVRLTPDGIELTAKAPFPALSGEVMVEGRYLLFRDADGLQLRLLPDRLDDTQRRKWAEQWSAFDQAADENLPGFRIEARRGALPPAFSWSLKTTDPLLRAPRVDSIGKVVSVPASDMDLRLLSPRGLQGIDGEVTLRPERYRLARFQDAQIPVPLQGKFTAAKHPVMLLAELVATVPEGASVPATQSRFVLRADGTKLEATLEKGDGSTLSHRCAHDERVLAEALRRAYGFAELRPGEPDRERPLLSAFTPLDDGWLQFPVPNLPPLNPAKDSDLIKPAAAPPGNVLAGFLRFAQLGNPPPVLSAFDKAAAIDVREAPWVVTVEGARAVLVAIGFAPQQENPATLVPQRAEASLDDPELSTRGLLWISDDRPDALEALPRLGAGAAAFLDLPLETLDTEVLPAVSFALQAMKIAVERKTSADVLTRPELRMSLAFDPAAESWSDLVTDAMKTALQKEWESLTHVENRSLDVPPAKGAVKKPGPLPLPPVVWRRHPRMPLASTMPMTRAASSAVRPLESRDLVPFVVDTGKLKEGQPISFARLTWTAVANQPTPVFPTLDRIDDSPLQLSPAAGWPWPKARAAELAKDSDEEPTLQSGIALAAFGVPGTELTFALAQAAVPKPLLFALRYDLPVLDEAFACSTLPPQPPEKTIAEERELPPAEPPATALDWNTMRKLWDEQDRRHQNARVMHSYLFDYRALPEADALVRDLIGRANWSTRSAFDIPAGTEDVPYGQALIDGEKVDGDKALLGVSGAFSVNNEKLTKGGNQIEVKGYAPSSFLENDFRMDSRRFGVKKTETDDDEKVLYRPVLVKMPRQGPWNTVAGLATLRAPMGVIRQAKALFQFWLKDLPIDKTGKFVPVSLDAIDFHAWQDGHLPLSGFEWRLVTDDVDSDAKSVLKRGRDRIPFFGLSLEPLRLRSCQLVMDDDDRPTGEITTVDIVCRLHLGPDSDDPESGGNLVLLTLTGPGDSLRVTGLKLLDDASPLRFVLTAGTRRVQVGAKCEWAADRPQLTGVVLAVSMLGGSVDLASAAAKSADTPAGSFQLSWTAPPSSGKFKLGSGTFAVDKITIDVKDEVELTELKRTIRITPAGAAETTGETTAPAIVLELADDKVTSLTMLELTLTDLAKARFEEAPGAVSVTLNNASMEKGQALLHGLHGGAKATGAFSLGLAARAGEFKNGVAELTAGMLDGAIVFTRPQGQGKEPHGASLQSIRFAAECGRRPQSAGAEAIKSWIGGLTFCGRLLMDNAIAWPVVTTADSNVPQPDDDPDGRTTLSIQQAKAHAHRAVYFLDGQRMPFDVAGRIAADDDAGAWTVPVACRHELTDAITAQEHSFIAVETISIGRAKALVPKIDQPFKNDPLTFAARFHKTVKDGAEKDKDVPGMRSGGSGRIATVLRGALGLAFRVGFASETRKGIFVAGGFVGVLAVRDGDSGPLLRLPVLAALDPAVSHLAAGTIEQNGTASVRVAWADSGAARQVVATLRSAVAPASTAEGALRAALIAGSRRPVKGTLDPGDVVTAILVEQSFVVPSDPKDDHPTVVLAKDPFFIASAVSVSAAVESLSRFADRKQTPTVLSLLAGRGLVRFIEDKKKKTREMGLAAAVVTRKLTVPEKPGQPLIEPPIANELTTLGDQIVTTPWTGGNVADLADAIPIGMVAGAAYADHVEPRVALLRTEGKTKGKNKTSRYDCVPLPRRAIRSRVAEKTVRRRFADAGRGYGWVPTETSNWLSAPAEGRMMPVRDDDPIGNRRASGIAGLSRPMRMPAHAVPVDEGSPESPLSGIVWTAQTRAPVYLPLALTEVTSVPIPWLSPAAPRPRLPIDEALRSAVKNLDLRVQPFLPERTTLASVGDRAGISLARITRFETALSPVPMFDRRYARFGRPAQGGSWSLRTERTPRPGPLPPNTGDPLRDRRPCTSPILSQQPANVLVGPADVVGGEPHTDSEFSFGAWTVTLVAAPEWDGRIASDWDGTIPVYAQIVVVPVKDKALPNPAEMLFHVILDVESPGTDDTAAQLRTRAALVIGAVVIPFRRLHLLALPENAAIPWENIGPDGKEGDFARRAVVKLILDARVTDSSDSRGTALPEIAAALTVDGPLPPVEIRASVHPSPKHVDPPVVAKRHHDLTIDDGGAGTIPSGDSRAPVTLRLPLSPVVPSRGALPLAPSSILFTDPTFDAGLSSAPAEHRAPIKPDLALSDARGALELVLYADRKRVNRKASITFMVDVAFERKAKPSSSFDGDLIVKKDNGFDLALRVVAKDGKTRDVFVGKPLPKPDPAFQPPQQPQIALATVYELPLANVVERDGIAAVLLAGDTFELEIAEKAAGQVKVGLADPSKSDGLPALAISKLHLVKIVRTLRIILTDEPVVEPPPALYAALVRRTFKDANGIKDTSLSLPLYAQSPLPWRVDLRDAKADFRSALMRRSATFVWSLSRPRFERDATDVYVVKVDRNGQTHLPSSAEFEKATTLRRQRA